MVVVVAAVHVREAGSDVACCALVTRLCGRWIMVPQEPAVLQRSFDWQRAPAGTVARQQDKLLYCLSFEPVL